MFDDARGQGSLEDWKRLHRARPAEREVTRFWKEERRTIIPLTVKDLLEENYARKLA
jgi:hypothetical protein